MHQEFDSLRMGSPHMSVGDEASDTKRAYESIVAFAEDVDVYEVESFLPWLGEYWYQKEDYGDFSLDRKACVVAYRKLQAKHGGVVQHDEKVCVHGLEGSLTSDIRELTAERRAEIVQEVLGEQEDQWEEGYTDPNEIRLVSIRCSSTTALEAFERAVHDPNDSYLPPVSQPASAKLGGSYQPPLAPHQFYYGAAGSPWGSGSQPRRCSLSGDSPIVPQRQQSKREMSASALLQPKKEPSWRTTLTKQESIRETSLLDSQSRIDTQPTMPRKQPSLKRDLDASGDSLDLDTARLSPTLPMRAEYCVSKPGCSNRDHVPKAVIRKPSVQFEVPVIQ